MDKLTLRILLESKYQEELQFIREMNPEISDKDAILRILAGDKGAEKYNEC